ncbi:hypothetical protein V6O07_04815 [Arthrospira platensis SPKY2]
MEKLKKLKVSDDLLNHLQKAIADVLNISELHSDINVYDIKLSSGIWSKYAEGAMDEDAANKLVQSIFLDKNLLSLAKKHNIIDCKIRATLNNVYVTLIKGKLYSVTFNDHIDTNVLLVKSQEKTVLQKMIEILL